MSTMKVRFYEAVCTEEITVPEVGKCFVGQTYRLNHWQAQYWGAAFDLKKAKTWVETVKMDDKSQAEVQATVERKEKEREAREAAMNAPKAGEKKQKEEKSREEVIMEMPAGQINDLLAEYGLSKKRNKQENQELVLKYEEIKEQVKEMTPEERLEALEKLGIQKPAEGDFDEVGAITLAATIEADKPKKAPKKKDDKDEDKKDDDNKKDGDTEDKK